MKTICPHCKQEYPETPDEYLGMTLQCSVCQKEFVCEKPKFCSECGKSSPAKALKCSQCGKFFPVISLQQTTGISSLRSSNLESQNNFSDGLDDDCFMEDVDWSTAWKKFAVFSGRSRPKEIILFGISMAILDTIVAIIAPSWGMVLLTLSLLASIPLDVRRLHDFGMSGWWLLSPFMWLVLPFIPSQHGANKYGPNPVDNEHNVSAIKLYSVIGIIWLVVLPLALLPALHSSRQKARILHCSSNLKQIGIGIVMFEQDNPGKMPSDLQTLISKDYLTDSNTCKCPTSSQKYIYLGNGVSEDCDGDIPVAMDAPGNHKKTVNILLKSGAVQTYIFSSKTKSCSDILRELFPSLETTKDGRIVLENARKIEAGKVL